MADLIPRTERRKRAWRPAWPKVPAAFVREVLAGHSALGLALGGLIYLICVTGTLAVFVADLRVWEQPQPRAAISAGFLDTAMAEGQARAAQGGGLYLMLPPQSAGRARLEIYGAGPQRTYALAADGHVRGALKTPFADFVDRLHMYLCLPTTAGLIVVGLSGAALLSLLISGLLAHPRIFRDAFTLRWGGSRRLQEADLHNRLSVWGLPFHLAVTLSGAFFGLSNVLLLALALVAYKGDTARVSGLLDGPAVAQDSRPAPLPPIGPMLQRVGVAQDLGRLNYIGVQGAGTRGAAISLERSLPGRLLRGEREFFDAQGRYLGPAGYAGPSVGKQAYAAAAALHFGTFGGLPVRLAYGVLGFALCVVCASGISIWAARRRDQGRPAPRLERLWFGTVWGVLIGLAAAALAGLAGTLPPALAFWLALAGSAGAALARPDATAASRLCRVTLAAALVGVALAHVARFWPAPGAEPFVIDGLCLAVAIGLALSLWPGRAGRVQMR